ncbi:MAG: branched-chain amino acid transporter permease [Proteobacteria bacterium]|nr:branched-chain amino acid transporter permease [Pseudomonadota bacterium]
MLNALFSGDFPRSKLLTALLLLVVVGLILTPLAGDKAMGVGAKICVFIILVASFDLMLGYTGILSFAHTMFFGIGAYSVAMISSMPEEHHWWAMGPGWTSVGVGVITALVVSAVVALVISIFSLRVRALYFSMITLSVAASFQILCQRSTEITGGDDGVNFKVPALLDPATVFADPINIFGYMVEINGMLLAYFGIFIFAIVLFLFMLRVINSPFGRVLQAIRDNEFRAAAIGYRVVYYRSTSAVVGSCVAALAGCAYALWLRYNGPETTLGFGIMMDILFMTVIGGMATLYGSVLGASIMLLAQGYLQDLMKILVKEVEGIPIVSGLLHPDRWLLWMGIFFIIVVYNFPWGIVGKLRMRALGIK